VWKYMELTTPGSYTPYKLDTATDQSMIMVVAKSYTVTPTSRFKFDVVLAAKRAQDNAFRAGGLDGLKLAVDKAKDFISKHVSSKRTIYGNAGIGGGTMSYTVGTPKTTKVRNDGSYSFRVPVGWTGTVTPSKARYTFDPLNKAFTNVTADQVQHFVATFVPCNDCGDANSDATIDISDAVFLIGYIFAGGLAPADCGYLNGKGDANGDLTVDISDAVFLISYIFVPGAAVPHCN